VIKAEFSASLLQFSVSRDPPEIILIWWFDGQETFLIIINVENDSVQYYCGHCDTLHCSSFIEILLNSDFITDNFW